MTSRKDGRRKRRLAEREPRKNAAGPAAASTGRPSPQCGEGPPSCLLCPLRVTMSLLGLFVTVRYRDNRERRVRERDDVTYSGT